MPAKCEVDWVNGQRQKRRTDRRTQMGVMEGEYMDDVCRSKTYEGLKEGNDAKNEKGHMIKLNIWT